MQDRQLRILLVDDDSNERSGVRFLIERGGFPLEILEASNGKRALELLEQETVDILFTDVKMPYMDGLELSATVCRRFPQIKIIVFSAYGEFEYAKKAMEAKAVNYLLKPVNVEEFETVLHSVIQKCREAERLNQQHQRRLKADRKLQWINLLMSKQPVTAIALQGLDLPERAEEKPVSLLRLESQSDFFAIFEQEILDILAEKSHGVFEYINVYPNCSYVIWFSASDGRDLRAVSQALIQCASQHGDCLLALADDISFPLGNLAEHVQKIEEMCQQMLLEDGTALFLSELASLNLESFSSVEEYWNLARDAIASGDKDSIEKSVRELLDSMSHQGVFSAAYIHHIFCDLFAKLYTQYGYTDNKGMRTAMRKLSGCRSKQALILLTQSVLEDAVRKSAAEQDVSYVVHRVKRIIHKEFSRDLSLDYLASSVGLAPSYLSFVFKRETGENIIKYLTDYRIDQARQMLESGRYKISQIARMCGYENPSYFNRLFKNAYGLTPSQYKEKISGK